MIQPTVGRVVEVYFRNKPGDPPALNVFGSELMFKEGVPVPALIAAVHINGSITVGGFDGAGMPFSRFAIQLVQEGHDGPIPDYCFAAWMPYQKGQAAKTEALEQARDKAAIASRTEPYID